MKKKNRKRRGIRIAFPESFPRLSKILFLPLLRNHGALSGVAEAISSSLLESFA